MPLDGADQFRGYLQDRLLRERTLRVLLELGVIDNDILDMFWTGDEPWTVCIPPGPEWN